MSSQTKSHPPAGVRTTNDDERKSTPVPKLPLPPLHQTLQRYLATLEAVVTSGQLEEAREAVKVFEQPGGIGEQLQQQLSNMEQEKENWAYDWWLDDMYMNNRLPLPVNSNPGMVFPRQKFNNQDDQLRFAVKIILGILDYKQSLDSNSLPVDMSGGKNSFPFCMAQNARLLTSHRRPESAKDRLVVTSPYHDGYHVIIANKGQFFELKVTQGSKTIPPGTLLDELKNILKAVNSETPEENVGILTSEHRDTWAEVRLRMCRETVNENSFDSIERALCVICLDDPLPSSFNYRGRTNDVTRDDTNAAHQMIHGGGSKFNSSNRWFDKTMEIVVGSDGVCGLCYEHSPAEGIVVIQLLEKLIQLPNENDKVTAKRTNDWPSSKKLKWKVNNPQVQTAIKTAAMNIDKLAEDVDFYVMRFDVFGKEFIKKCRVSPDVFIQLSLQFTFYKMYNRLVSTYESASTRRFHLGRVDNIRAATIEVLQWVNAMLADDKTQEDRLQLFHIAVRKQTEIMTQNITGQGIDCHLLALRELAKERGLSPKLFTNECYSISNHFALSTSQVSTLTDSFMGYGAVVPDGYGTSYNLGPNSILFCIASFGSCKETNSELFAQNLDNCLILMKQLVSE